MRICTVDGCGGKHLSLGLCPKHYRHLRAHGHMTVSRPRKRRNRRLPNVCECGERAWVALTKGYVTHFDPEDLEAVAAWNWSARVEHRAVYAFRTEDSTKRTLMLHNVISNPPPGLVVDHANNDALDNRRANLRHCSPKQNAFNRRHKTNKKYTPLKGVTKQKGTSKWMLCFNSKYVGTFATPEDAAREYDRMAIERFGEFAKTNVALGLLPPLAEAA